MKKSKLLRITAVIQVLVLLLTVFSLSVFAAPSKTVSLEADKTTVAPGDEVIISVKSNEAFTAFAFDVEIGFQTDSFSVKKIVVAQSGKSGIMSNTADGKLRVNWMAESSNENWNAGKLFDIYLSSKKTALGEKTFSINKFKAYGEDLVDVPFTAGENIIVNLAVPQKSDTVLYAEEKIADIGTVTATPECLARITEAQLAFNGCTSAEKLLVENRDDLTAAIKKYNRLKAEQNEADNQAALDKEISDYRNQHGALLALTPETVNGTHLVGLTEAVVEYAQKPLYIKNKLKDDYEKLLALQNIAKQISTSPEEVASFRSAFASLLSLTPEMLAYEDEQSFNSIKENIDAAIVTYGYLNDLSKKTLQPEYDLLQKLTERWVELDKLNSPEPEWVTEQYNDFRTKYLTLLLKTEGEITADDVALIQQALSELKNLKPQVSGKLINEYEQLMNFLNVLNTTGGAEEGTAGGTTTVEVPVETLVEVPVETVIQVPVGSGVEEAEAKGGLVSVSAPSSGRFGIIVFVLMFTAFVLFAIPAITYLIMNNKTQQEEDLI